MGRHRAGAVFAIIGAALLFTPLCLVCSSAELQVICDPTTLPRPRAYVSYYLRTFQKPDDDCCVYGSLNETAMAPLALAPHRRLFVESSAHDDAIGITAEAMPESGLLSRWMAATSLGAPRTRTTPASASRCTSSSRPASLAGGAFKQLAPIKNVVRACFCETARRAEQQKISATP